ncbi:2789_t:CDS:2 [Paraglomus brasilianum]|uniref:2789_t:CDS:1 n=1 Tax=Paraglomus brasilianum TaxID=144538 RepID=A0A9N9G0F6_9GLOM|nr:2789_t:CDS:2 [Paraglomus brasilianum]
MSHLRLTTLGRSLRHAHILSTQPAFRLSFLSPLGQQRANYAEFGKPRVSDPMIGDYPNKPWEPRGLRPPTGWWDEQERLNSEEELHEEEEVMSLFSTDIYTETTPGKAVRDLLISAGVVGSIGLIVYLTLPERPMVLRTYPFDGLRVELGGNPNDPNDLTRTGRVSVE